MSLLLNTLAYTNGALIAAAGISTARRTWDRSIKDLALQRAACELAKVAFIAALAYEVLAIRPHPMPGLPAAAFWLTSILVGSVGLGTGVAKRRGLRAQRTTLDGSYPELAQGSWAR